MSRLPINPYHDLRESAGREAFANLFRAEEHFVAPEDYTNHENAITARRYAVSLIANLKNINDCDDALVPYTAMNYFDRLISRGDVQAYPVDLNSEERLKLCSFCCFSIAWKYRTKNFSFSRFLKTSEHYSESQVLEMELYICRRLEWRMRAITPFCFIEYFIPILDLPRRGVRQLIVKSQFDIAFTVYRPSVVAAAATIVICKHKFPTRHRDDCVNRIIFTTPEFLNPFYKDMILQCEQQLDHLYNGDGNIDDEEEDDERMDFELGWIDAQGN